MKKVFLGGDCNGSSWREELIEVLKIDYFNPEDEDWTEEYYHEELRQRELCDYCLYVITPRMEGMYSIAEVVDNSNKRPEKTLFCIVSADFSVAGNFIIFNEQQLKSLDKVGRMVQENGGKYFRTLREAAKFLNNTN